MKRLVGIAIGLALSQGCASDGSSHAGSDAAGTARSNNSTPVQAASLSNGTSSSAATVGSGSSLGGNDVIARINGRQITMQELRQPLLEAYGLNVLLNVVQLDLAKSEAQKRGVTIGPSDVEEERRLTTERLFSDSDADSKIVQAIDAAEMKKDTVEADRLKKLLKDSRDRLLVQFLEQQKVSRPEFELVLQTNAYLRKIAEPQIKGKITDEQLHQAFDAQFGASVKIRHIQGNLADLETAKKRIEGGAKFEDVAREMSDNKVTGAVGGEMRPFTLANPNYPENFKHLAFDLKEGEVSEVIEAGGTYHILKLEQRIPPKAVKFENVRDSLRAKMYDGLMQEAIRQLRDRLAAFARQDLKIEEPTLRDQFQKKLDERETVIRDQQKMREEMDKAREQGTPGGIPPVGSDAPKTAPTTTKSSDATNLAPVPAVAPKGDPAAAAAAAAAGSAKPQAAGAPANTK